jgi:hypothetical protein
LVRVDEDNLGGRGRPLHLIRVSEDAGASRVAQLADEEPGALVVVIGPAGGVRIALDLGLEVVAAHQPPFGSVVLGASTLARIVREAVERVGPSRIVCRDPALRSVASEVAAGRPVVEPTDLEAFVDPARLVDKRAQLRTEWGVADGTFVVGLLGDPVGAMDARRAADIVGVARVRGLDVVLIVHPRAARVGLVLRWTAALRPSLGDVRWFRTDERLSQPWRVARAFDAVLALGPGVRTAGGAATRAVIDPRPSLWAHAAGVPIVAEAHPSTSQVATSTFAVDDPLAGTRAILALAGFGLNRSDPRNPPGIVHV